VDGKLLDAMRARYDATVAWGIAINAHRDWPSGLHPGYTLAGVCRPESPRCGASRSTSRCRSPATPPNSPAHSEAPDEDQRLLAQRRATPLSVPTWAPSVTTASTPCCRSVRGRCARS
jgi:hypothetical protein